MSLIAFGSLKGSPGATTAALAVAACWSPPRDVVLVEADPAGGDLTARFDLRADLGLVPLASATRRGPAGETLLTHSQELPGPLLVVTAPASATQARAALEVLAPAVTATWAARTVDVLADCGRLDPSSPSRDLFDQATVGVIVARPALADLAHLAAHRDDLHARQRSLVLLLAGTGPYPPEEVSAAVNLEVIGVLPWDPDAAGLLGGQAGSARRLARSPLMRNARTIAGALTARLGAPPTVPPTPTAAPNGTRSAVPTR